MSDTTNQSDLSFSLGRSVLILSLVVGVGVVLIRWALVQIDWANHINANLVAAACCFVGSVLGLLPVKWLSRRMAEGASLGFMLGILFRMMFCATAALVLIHYFGDQLPGFGYWVAGWYLLLLIVDVALVVSYQVKRFDTQPPAADTTEVIT